MFGWLLRSLVNLLVPVSLGSQSQPPGQVTVSRVDREGRFFLPLSFSFQQVRYVEAVFRWASLAGEKVSQNLVQTIFLLPHLKGSKNPT